MRNRNAWRPGLGVIVVLAVMASPASATPPGENGPIVWQSYTGLPANYEIWSMNPDGSGEDELTDNSFHDERAQISPDGSQITYMAQPAIESGDSVDIWRMDSDGSNKTAVTDNAFGEYEPTWSPDSSKIVFMRQYTGGQDLFRVDANGSNDVNLTNSPNGYECCAEYSPDGSKIAFTTSGDVDGDPKTPAETDNEIFVIDANGSNLTRLTDNTAQDVGPTWSPDGSRIAWANVDTGALWTMNSNGSNPAALTGAGGYYAPVWSPDGTRIAAAFGVAEIYSVSVANPLEVLNLTQTPGVQDEYPSWAPSGGGGDAPDTHITKRPKDVIKKDKAKYEFGADPAAGATFECKLDGKPFKPCTSPHELKNLSKSKHKFQVRSTAGGQTDPTPAKDQFKAKPRN